MCLFASWGQTVLNWKVKMQKWNRCPFSHPVKSQLRWLNISNETIIFFIAVFLPILYIYCSGRIYTKKWNWMLFMSQMPQVSVFFFCHGGFILAALLYSSDLFPVVTLTSFSDTFMSIDSNSTSFCLWSSSLSFLKPLSLHDPTTSIITTEICSSLFHTHHQWL